MMLVLVGTYLFWGVFGTSLPILPRLVTEELGAGPGAVGIVFGAYAAAAVLVRPLVGALGDRWSRRLLLITGGLVSATGMALHLVVASVPGLLVARTVAGAGSAAVVVGFATIALDLAPRARHGEASSYVMVAVQLGMGTGPLLGVLLLDLGSYALVWVVGAIVTLACPALALVLPRELPTESVSELVGEPSPTTAGRARLLVHPAGLRPGVVLGLGIVGFIGYLAFVPLYAPQVGVAAVAPLLLLSSGALAVVRAVGARIPDRLGAVRSASIALVLLALTFVAMSTLATPVGLYVTTVAMAVGAALLAPSLVLAAVQGVAPRERARVMATVTMFLDVAGALGPALLGLLVATRGFSAMFLAVAAAALTGLVLLHRWVAPRVVRVVVPLEQPRPGARQQRSDAVSRARASHPAAS